MDDINFIIERNYLKKNDKNVKRHIVCIVSWTVNYPALYALTMTNKTQPSSPSKCPPGKRAGWCHRKLPTLLEGRGGSSLSSVPR